MVLMIANTPYNETHNYTKHNNNNNTNNKNNSNNKSECDIELEEYELTEDEIQVANTLLDMPYLITKSLLSYRFPVYWGSKRRRSAVENPPPPLTFSHRNTLFDKTREELKTMVEEKFENQLILKQEIEKVRLYLEKVKAENYELKAKKQKLELDNNTNNNDHVHAGPSTSNQLSNEQPLMNENPTVQIEQEDNSTARLKVDFDLNEPAEEQEMMEFNMVNELQPLDRPVMKELQLLDPPMVKELQLLDQQKMNESMSLDQHRVNELQPLDRPVMKELQLLAPPMVKELQLLDQKKVNESMSLDQHRVNGLQPLDQQMEYLRMNRAVKAEARRKRMLIYKSKKLARAR